MPRRMESGIWWGRWLFAALCARACVRFLPVGFFVFALPLVVAVAGLVWSGNHFVT